MKQLNQKPYAGRAYSYYQAPSVASSVKKRHKLWPMVLFLGLVVFVLTNGYHLVAKRVSAKNNLNPQVAAAITNAPNPNDIEAMGQKINTVIASNPSFQVAVSITDVNTGASHNYGVGEGYIAASTAKLITATLFLHEVETGHQSLNDNVGDHDAQYQLQQLIEQSDNDAWLAFNTLLTHPALAAWAAQVGLTNYNADTNILTSQDVATLLYKLYQNKLLNTEHTNLLLSYMQSANETKYITNSIPAGIKTYHKAGWLEDRIHDAAIIDNGKNPYILVIFTKTTGSYNVPSGQNIFNTITKATVSAFINHTSL